MWWQSNTTIKVALRKESVDRNKLCKFEIVIVKSVALRKESVDRNDALPKINTFKLWSLSARRAWIEIRLVSGLV